MIYDRPEPADRIDQGDIVRDCPLVSVVEFPSTVGTAPRTTWGVKRGVVLTQTCDLAQRRVTQVVVAVAIEVADLVARGELKAADVRGPIRSGRIFGWYFLPADRSLGIPELIVDFRQLHTIPLHLLEELCRKNHRDGRVRPLYREHLARHFADTYSRIGLPEPYPAE